MSPRSLKPDPWIDALGEAVKALREERGLTQAQLAARAGIDVTYVGHIERGERNPTLIALTRVCRGLGVRMPMLFTRIEERYPAGGKAS